MSKIDKNICVSFGNMSFEKCIETLKICSFAEIRFDLLNFTSNETKQLFNQDCSIIATYRPGNISELLRKEELFKAINYGADYIDLEFDAPSDYFNSLFEKVKNHNTKVIISYHNYSSTPQQDELFSIVEKCVNMGADIVKIACQINSSADLSNLLCLYNKFDKIIAIGMGKKGVMSRLSAISLGSPFTYVSASSNKKTALGQLSYSEFQQIKKKKKQSE